MNNDILTWQLAAYDLVIRGDETTSEDQVASACTPDMARRIAACVNVCGGISTSVLELNATAGGVVTLERQRDALAAALESVVAQNPGSLAQAEAALAMIAPGTANQVAPPRYTSISKGGSYERLGSIRGAGSLKGLSGIAYRNEKGDLFMREPECFAKRMVPIKPEGGV